MSGWILIVIVYILAMWDDKSVYPKIESGFAFKRHMNDVYVDSSNNQSFDESATLKMKYYSPPDLILQHSPIEEKLKTLR